MLGHNGAGKSTLLSLINGDNPQAYANDIILFDKKRGTGESIWDIKRR
ncbi:ATP-binding cassette domain-containing protein [Mucilaginibacter humi]|nr:ATP-binding cassette domain-containing protein [Mucilaginibacter humi]